LDIIPSFSKSSHQSTLSQITSTTTKQGQAKTGSKQLPSPKIHLTAVFAAHSRFLPHTNKRPSATISRSIRRRASLGLTLGAAHPPGYPRPLRRDPGPRNLHETQGLRLRREPQIVCPNYGRGRSGLEPLLQFVLRVLSRSSRSRCWALGTSFARPASVTKVEDGVGLEDFPVVAPFIRSFCPSFCPFY
jgi:hypothetical protein